MQRATEGGAYRQVEEYIQAVLGRAKQLAGVELEVQGNTPEERAVSLLDSLIKHGLAEELADYPAPIPLPAHAWQGIEAVRSSGLTNMLDRPMVIRLALELGYPEAADWIESHLTDYAEGVFRGFCVDPIHEKA